MPRKVWMLLLLLVFAHSSALCQSKPKQTSDPAAAAIAKIVDVRTNVEGSVQRLTDHYKQSDPDCSKNACDHARDLYDKAQGAYTGWVEAVKLAIIQGNANKIDSSSTYQDIAKNASSKGADFLNYVDKEMGQSAAVPALVTTLANLGIQLWNGIKKAQLEQRQAVADSFEKSASWHSWNDLTKPHSTTDKEGSKPDSTSTDSTSTQKKKKAKKPAAPPAAPNERP